MREAEPWIAYPGPGQKLTSNDKNQTENNKNDKQQVNEKDGVCNEEVKSFR